MAVGSGHSEKSKNFKSPFLSHFGHFWGFQRLILTHATSRRSYIMPVGSDTSVGTIPGRHHRDEKPFQVSDLVILDSFSLRPFLNLNLVILDSFSLRPFLNLNLVILDSSSLRPFLNLNLNLNVFNHFQF